MSIYSESRSPVGTKGAAGTDDRALFLTNFGELVILSWDETFDFGGLTFVRNITSGKSDTFPIIGRKRDAVEHTPGEIILGGGVEHNEVEIAVDGMIVESAFIADIDELLNHYALSEPYARQIGESMASISNTRIGACLVRASRVTTAPYTGGPVPSYNYHADMLTDASKLEDAAFAGVQYIKENDVGGGEPTYFLPWQQQLLLARYTGIDTNETSGSGNRAAGTVGPIAGIGIKGTNSIPNTNITTGRTKYQGNFTTTVGVIANRMAVGTLRRRGMKVTMDHKNDRLGTLMIGSKLEGHDLLRPECSFEVANASR